MKLTRRELLGLSASSLLAVAAGARGQVPAEAQDQPFDLSYRVITPQPAPEDRIEVVDFFWYGCPYCYQLLPMVLAWEKTKPEDVTLRRVPAILRTEWVPHAHFYYTMDLLGVAGQLHAKAFDAFQRDRLNPTDLEATVAWATANGIDRQKWLDAFNTKEVRERVVQAADVVKNYDVHGTPAMVVDGRWQTGGGQAGSIKNVIPTVDGLIKLARARRLKA